MAEPIVINAETREITVPESERSFGVAGEHNVARKHFRINGRIVDGNDLAVGFAWKVCTENSAKQPNEYPIDSIIADSDGIEFDWLVGKGALTYKGSLKFAVCAKQVNGEGKVQHEWHSRIGTGKVYDGIAKHPEGRLDQSPDSRNGGKKCGHRQNCGAKRAEGCREERGQRSQQRIGSQDLCGAGCRRPRHGAGAGGPCDRG